MVVKRGTANLLCYYLLKCLIYLSYSMFISVSRPVHKRKQIGLLISLKTVHPATTGHDETNMTLICRYS